MRWSHWVRVLHRWSSVFFTLAFVVTSVAMAQKEPVVWMSYLPLPPLAVLFLTGVPLFVLPYLAKRRSGGAPSSS